MERYSFRRLDSAAYPHDERALAWLLQASAGFHPNEVHRRARLPTSVVLFVVADAEPATPVGLAVLEAYAPRVAKISWLYVTLRHRGNHLGDRLVAELLRIAGCRADAQVDAFCTYETHKYYTRFGFVTSKTLKHTVSLSATKGSLVDEFPWIAPMCATSPSDVLASGEDKVVLRLATPADRKEWCALVLNACNYDMGGGDMVQITLDAAFRCVAVLPNAELVGLVCMSATGWVPFLCCRETHRSRGLGSLLLAVATEWLRRSAAVTNATAIDVSLSPLRRRNVTFYERKGFSLEEPLRSAIPFEKNKLLMCRPVHPKMCVLPMQFGCLEDVLPEPFVEPARPAPEPDFGRLLDELAASSRRKKKAVEPRPRAVDAPVDGTVKQHRPEIPTPAAAC